MPFPNFIISPLLAHSPFHSFSSINSFGFASFLWPTLPFLSKIPSGQIFFSFLAILPKGVFSASAECRKQESSKKLAASSPHFHFFPCGTFPSFCWPFFVGPTAPSCLDLLDPILTMAKIDGKLLDFF